ncbi:hypothetical protein SELMODRAFT_419229 [Selaginella moellendorffii]|uniref:Uncharacterized protein n=1 Tax=Selaginella moellendorffii TaxID=88036 RepID=D8S895_SELML|nr:hypothetical protein SELMODRAFT_419229 [Selaginella moellendorffii]
MEGGVLLKDDIRLNVGREDNSEELQQQNRLEDHVRRLENHVQRLDAQQKLLSRQLQQLLQSQAPPPQPSLEEILGGFSKEEPVLKIVDGWYAGWERIWKAAKAEAVVGFDQYGHLAVHLGGNACVVVARDGLADFQRLELQFPRSQQKSTVGYVLKAYEMCGDPAAGARVLVTEDRITPSITCVDTLSRDLGEHVVLGCNEAGDLEAHWGQMQWVELPSGLKIADIYKQKFAHLGVGSGAKLDGGAVFSRDGYLGIATRKDETSYWIWQLSGAEAPQVNVRVQLYKKKLAKAGFMHDRLD